MGKGKNENPDNAASGKGKPVGQITGRPRPGAGKWEDREPYVKDAKRGGR